MLQIILIVTFCTSINPGATEICNGIDDDCNGQIDDVPLQPLFLLMLMETVMEMHQFQFNHVFSLLDM